MIRNVRFGPFRGLESSILSTLPVCVYSQPSDSFSRFFYGGPHEYTFSSKCYEVESVSSIPLKEMLVTIGLGLGVVEFEDAC